MALSVTQRKQNPKFFCRPTFFFRICPLLHSAIQQNTPTCEKIDVHKIEDIFLFSGCQGPDCSARRQGLPSCTIMASIAASAGKYNLCMHCDSFHTPARIVLKSHILDICKLLHSGFDNLSDRGRRVGQRERGAPNMAIGSH
jgi:hypothetical protein